MGRKSAGARREDVRRLNNRKVIGRAKSRIDFWKKFYKTGECPQRDVCMLETQKDVGRW